MEGAVDLFEIFPVDVCVDLCCRNVGVTKHFLDGAEVCPPFEKVRRKRVPERVRVNLFLDAGGTGVLYHHIPDRRT